MTAGAGGWNRTIVFIWEDAALPLSYTRNQHGIFLWKFLAGP